MSAIGASATIGRGSDLQSNMRRSILCLMNISRVLRSPWFAAIPGAFLVAFFWNILVASFVPREAWGFIYWVGGARFAYFVVDTFFRIFCANRACPGLGLDGGPYHNLELSILIGCVLLWSAIQAGVLFVLSVKFIAFYNKGLTRHH